MKGTTMDATNAVWQSLTDEQLRTLTPAEFYEAIAVFDLSDEDAEDAWYEFEMRVREVL